MVSIDDEVKSIEIILLSEKDSEMATTLINSTFGAKKSAETIEWDFFQNPVAKKISPILVGAKDSSGEIVGLYCHLPVQLTAKEKTINGLYGCYRAVKKELRGKGIYKMLFNASEEEIKKIQGETPILFGLAKQGFFNTDKRISAIFQVNTRHRLKKISKPLTLIATLRSASFFSLLGKGKQKKQYRKLIEFEDIQPALQKLNEFPLNSHFSGITAKADNEFIRWRFGKEKGERYFAVGLSNKEGMSAYAILKEGGKKLLLKHFDAINSNELSLLLSLLEEKARREGYQFIEFEGLPSELFEKAFRENHYLFRESIHFLQAYIPREIKKLFPENFFEKEENWLLTATALLSE